MSELLYDRIYQFLSGRQTRLTEVMENFTLGSIIGSVRNRNEDVAAIINVKHANSPRTDFTLALICDGMGGMTDGRKAALIAASTFVASTLGANPFDRPSERLKIALAAAQRAVFDSLHGEGGTTLSALYIDQTEDAWIAHVGDSRIYSITLDRSLRQISRDDTIGAALKRENEKHADFNRLIQFIGIDGDLDPQILSIVRRSCSGFLLTSDGAHGAAPDIMSTVSHHAKTGQELVRKLLHLADALGGLDNATAIHIPSEFAATQTFKPPGNGEPDVLASILSTSGLREIWITQADKNLSDREYPMNQAYRESSPDKRKNKIPNVRNKPPKKRKTNKKPETQSNDELPLGIEKPVAKLDFSDDGDDKS